MALLQLCKACGPAFGPFVDEDLVQLLLSTIVHTNRFVRETTFLVAAELATLVNAHAADVAIAVPAFRSRLAAALVRPAPYAPARSGAAAAAHHPSGPGRRPCGQLVAGTDGILCLRPHLP